MTKPKSVIPTVRVFCEALRRIDDAAFKESEMRQARRTAQHDAIETFKKVPASFWRAESRRPLTLEDYALLSQIAKKHHPSNDPTQSRFYFLTSLRDSWNVEDEHTKLRVLALHGMGFATVIGCNVAMTVRGARKLLATAKAMRAKDFAFRPDLLTTPETSRKRARP